MLALLAAKFGDLDLADDSVQDALVRAVEAWRDQGIPTNPAGWLYTVAHHRAVDRLRRAASAERRLRNAAVELTREPDDPEEVPIVEASEVGDEQLRLMLLCCHPALDRDTQVALTLRLVGGLTTEEIAAAFLVPEATLAQRIVRAKRKIRTAGIPLTIPADLGERVDALLTVLYLIFNEAYLSRGSTDAAIRADLADQAIRLTAGAADLLDGDPEAAGLLALELYHRARMDARLDAGGDLVLLEDQDRSRWDLTAVRRGNLVLAQALEAGEPGPYRLQALIAGIHANAPTAAGTDWTAIAHHYGRLLDLVPTPVVALNHAVAVAMADGPQAGLALLDSIDGLDGYHLFHAARGELLLRSGDTAAALSAFVRARELASGEPELRHLERRMTAAGRPPTSQTGEAH